MNYFNSLPLRLQLDQLAKCRFMDKTEFSAGVDKLRGKKIVILGCGAQGLNQGLNMRDSGLDISYALRADAIAQKRQSWKSATENSFRVGTFEELIPSADLVLNLTPDKQHTPVIEKVMPLMKKGSCLAYSHGFNIVEEGMQIRKDITVIMVAPKCPAPKFAKNTSAVLVFLLLLQCTAKMIPMVTASKLQKPMLQQPAVIELVYSNLLSLRKLNPISWANRPYCVACCKQVRCFVTT
jgi:hypothetical protein